jgi:hypothetical protein
MKLCLSVVLLIAIMLSGCGTTRWSDTQRTATEQLLISDAIDRVVSQIDSDAVAGKTVYLDATPIKQMTDSAYLTSTLRQHLLAAGCILKEKREEADYVVEVRAGAVGTDRHDLLFGVPATKIPLALPVPGLPSALPELPLVTKTEQRAVAKIAVFAYNRHTGRPVWQSGVIPVESKIRDLWVFGAGPFQRSTIYQGTMFANQRVQLPLAGLSKKGKQGKPNVASVAQEAYFTEPEGAVAEGHQREPPPQKREKKDKRPPVELAHDSVDLPSTDAKSPPPEAKKDGPAEAPSGVIPAGHVEPAAAPPTDSPPAQPPAPGPSVEEHPKMPKLDFLDLPTRIGKGRASGAK